jgi:hypothetical protein
MFLAQICIPGTEAMPKPRKQRTNDGYGWAAGVGVGFLSKDSCWRKSREGHSTQWEAVSRLLPPLPRVQFCTDQQKDGLQREIHPSGTEPTCFSTGTRSYHDKLRPGEPEPGQILVGDETEKKIKLFK